MLACLRASLAMNQVLRVDGLRIAYGTGRGRFTALQDIDLDIAPGETLGLIGESGSGKSTLGRAILRRIDPDAGRIRQDGADITHLRGAQLRAVRRKMQMVFQDPYASLNPGMTVFDLVAEPLRVHEGLRGTALRDRVLAMLEAVGLPLDAAERTPHAFSGGQRQRIGIARALILTPLLVVADEPVSALDVSVRAQVVNLMTDLQAQHGVAYLFIAHDLSIVRHVSHRIAILYCGAIVETGPRAAMERPLHPYTQALLRSELRPDPATERTRPLVQLNGETPSPLAPPSGCRFHTRCPKVRPICHVDPPRLLEHPTGHRVACHFPESS